MESKPSIYPSHAFGKNHPIIVIGMFVLYFVLFFNAPKIVTHVFISNDVVLNPQNLWALTNASLICGLITYWITGLLLSRYHLFSSAEQVFLTRLSAAGLVYVLAIPIQFMVWMNPLTFHQGETYDVALFHNGHAYHIKDEEAIRLPRQSSNSRRVIDFSLSIVKGEPVTVSGNPISSDVYKKPASTIWIKNGLLEKYHHLAFKVYIDTIQISANATETSQAMSNKMNDLTLLDSLHPEKNLDQRIFFCPEFVTNQKTIIVMPNEVVELEFNMPKDSELYFQKSTVFDFLRMTVDLIPIPTDEDWIKGTKRPFTNDPTRWLRKLDS